MTREEAKEILEEVKVLDDSMYQYNPAYLEALEMAIEALRAEPCEDAISRKHLLSEIGDLMKSPWFNRYKDDGGALHFGYTERKEAVEIVRDLCVKTEPPVTPKPRTGKWVPTQHFDKWFGLTGECSNCGEEHIFGLPYCPCCGAKMEGEGE